MKKTPFLIAVIILLVLAVLTILVFLNRGLYSTSKNSVPTGKPSSLKSALKNEAPEINNPEKNENNNKIFQNDKLGFAFDYSTVKNFFSIRTLDYTDPEDLKKNLYPTELLVDPNAHYADDKAIFSFYMMTAYPVPTGLGGTAPNPNVEFELNEFKTNASDANQWLMNWKQNIDKRRAWDKIEGFSGEAAPEMTTENISVNGINAVMYKMSKNLYLVDKGMVILRHGFIFNFVYKGYFPIQEKMLPGGNGKAVIEQERAEFDEMAKSFRFL